MSKEYESCIDCAYYDIKRDIDTIVQQERARIRAALESKAQTVEISGPYTSGYLGALVEVINFLDRAGDPHEALPKP